MRVRESGRVVNVAVVHAVGVNADGYRETLGIDVISTEDGAGWTAFLRGLVARGLSGCSWGSLTPTVFVRHVRDGNPSRSMFHKRFDSTRHP